MTKNFTTSDPVEAAEFLKRTAPDSAARASSLSIHSAALDDLRVELAATRTKLDAALTDAARGWARVKLLENRLNAALDALGR